MGVKKITKVEVTCDICGEDCKQSDSIIRVVVKSGMRDVGESVIQGRLRYFEPYFCDDGIICKKCMIKYLLKYLSKEIDINRMFVLLTKHVPKKHHDWVEVLKMAEKFGIDT